MSISDYFTKVKNLADVFASIGAPIDDEDLMVVIIATPLWDKCEGEAHTPKSEKLESSRTPENLELEFRGQISLHSSFLYFIGKVLKCKCPKCPHMNHLDICSPSYGQKKGQESN
jgi:hypothetical protein